MRRRWPGLGVLLGLLLASGCQERRVVVLSAGFDRDSGLPEGFQCEDDNERRLLDRTKQARIFSVRVDFMRVGGGVPLCREAELRAWCETHRCQRLTPTPRCIDAIYDDAGVEATLAPVQDAFARLRDQLVVPDAPDGVVLVRLIGSLQPCSEDIINPDLVVGCVRSCPNILAGTSGLVPLEDFGLAQLCEANVKVCASENYREQN